MKNKLKIFAVVLLLMNGTGAIIGGWHLMAYPDGSSLKMPLYLLKYSPFPDFLIPGFILFATNGLQSIFASVAVVSGFKNYSWFIILQGAILTVWIAIQVIMIRGVGYLHFIYFFTGMVFIGLGILLLTRYDVTGRANLQYR